jgi:para-nitrobenzyl esterase
MTFFMGADSAAFALSESELLGRAEKMLGARAQAGLALYRELHPHFTPSQTYVRMVTDREMMAPTMRQANLHAAARAAATYVYRFDWGSPALDGKLGALHTLEANFVFNTLDADPDLTGSGPEARALADRMSHAWVNFAASGDPGAGYDGLRWPLFEPRGGETMVFDGLSQVQRNPVAAEYRFMSEVLV